MNPEKSEKIVIGITAGLCVLITLLDFTGILDNIEWLSNRIPVMTLLAVGIFGFYELLADTKRQEISQKSHEISQKNHFEILDKLSFGGADQNMVSELNTLLDQRERDIRVFFEAAVQAASDRKIESLIDFIEKSRASFKQGDWFGVPLSYPWDFTISLISSEGTWLNHDEPKLLRTRIPQGFPWGDILHGKNGRLVWLNPLKSAQMWKLIPDEHCNIFRITRIHFQEIVSVKAILIFESHLNVIHQLPTKFGNVKN